MITLRKLNMRVYIAGPITGMPRFNQDAFYDTERVLKDYGYETVNPFEIAKRLGTWDEIQKSFEALYSGDKGKRSELAREMIETDLEQLQNCDAIYLLPGWRRSKGTLQELGIAKKCGLEIMDGESSD